MSMGGLPSSAWADAVNLAYDAGVVLVCAAGNSYAGLPTSLIVYPARFQRVIAACGIMAEGHPYLRTGRPDGGQCRTRQQDGDGDGRLYAEHPVAAAWLPRTWWTWTATARHRRRRRSPPPPRFGWRNMATTIRAAGSGWKRCAPRCSHRLISTGSDTRNDPDPFFGRGSLRAARGAADKYVPAAASLRKTDPDSACIRLPAPVVQRIRRRLTGASPNPAMLQVELTQLALNSREAREAIPDPGVPRGSGHGTAAPPLVRGDPRRRRHVPQAAPEARGTAGTPAGHRPFRDSHRNAWHQPRPAAEPRSFAAS